MEKTNFYILSLILFLSLLCNSEDYEYDDYNYTDDSNDDLNDYHNQNLLAPPNPSPPPPRPFPIPPPPLPPPPMGKITFFYFKYYEI